MLSTNQSTYWVRINRTLDYSLELVRVGIPKEACKYTKEHEEQKAQKDE
jgi:hypothetical protein